MQLLRQLDLDQFGREGDDTRSLSARLALMRGDLEGACRWADSFAAPVPQAAWPWQDPPHIVKARILLARGADADLRSGLEILDELLERASFSQFGSQATGVVQRGEAQEDHVVGTRAQPASGADPDLSPLVEPLTTRELEILRLFPEPLSGKEIARRFYISYETFKRHSISIYAKLGVNKRWAAVARAEALGLLPPRPPLR